jgi:hypothetical protein
VGRLWQEVKKKKQDEGSSYELSFKQGEETMALGDLVLDETAQITGIRILSTDASGTKVEVSLQTTGTIRGVDENTLWTYTTLTRPDGSIIGEGQGVMTTKDGDVISLTGHGSSKTPPLGGTTNFRTMLYAYTTSAKYSDLNSIGLAGEYDVSPDGSAVNKCWEWK